MMEPQIIEVSVAPGPLGILLNGDDAARPALLEGFAPISTDGDIGDVERDGRVPKGSELIGVNEYDFEEWKLTFAEIGQVLRETSHLQRTLRFRVTPTIEVVAHGIHSPSDEDDGGFQEIDESEVDDALGVRSLSPPSSTGTKSWSVKDLRSPRSIADPSVSGSSSPKYEPTNQESTAVTEEGDSLRRVQVDVPAGPLGLNLDGTTVDKALVLGFVPLPDGSKGPVELSGRVQPGSVLIEVNGEDVSKLPLSEIAAMLGALSGEPKQLIFQLPDPSWTYPAPTLSKTKSGSARTVPKFVQDMDKRRKLELALVLKFDSSKLARRECWFMVDANWMSLWVDFAARGGPLPGPITNEVLLQEDWETKTNDDSLGRPDEPREGLQITKHYRAVSPMVWCIFCQLHGVTPNVPVLARYVLDIYSERIRNSDLKPLLTECRLKAASLVSDMLDQCEVKVDG